MKVALAVNELCVEKLGIERSAVKEIAVDWVEEIKEDEAEKNPSGEKLELEKPVVGELIVD